MAIYCGIDWAEGASRPRPDRGWAALVAKRRIEENLDGVTEMTAMLSAAGDSPDEPIPVAIETPRGRGCCL